MNDKWHEFWRLMLTIDPNAMNDPRYLGLLGIGMVISVAYGCWLSAKCPEILPRKKILAGMVFAVILSTVANATYVGFL